MLRRTPGVEIDAELSRQVGRVSVLIEAMRQQTSWRSQSEKSVQDLIIRAYQVSVIIVREDEPPSVLEYSAMVKSSRGDLGGDNKFVMLLIAALFHIHSIH